VLTPPALALLAKQDDVVSRAQLLDLGLDDNVIERMLRRRELFRAARGVYRRHPGDPSWTQSVWIACLRFAPAAADPASTLALVGIGHRPKRVGVVVEHERRVVGEKGIAVTRMRDFTKQTKLDQHPPRLKLERAAILAASGKPDEQAVVALLADVTHSRRTTPARLRRHLRGLSRVAHRALIEAVLVDLEDGQCSNLERLFVARVERPHGLPPGQRQVRRRTDGKVVYRDVEYLGGLLVVELDGRLGHDTSEERWADAERDLVTTLQGGRTLRLVWQQVLDSCRAAQVVAALLGALRWQGRAVPCGPGCPIPPPS
jgi:hypothetical protein